MAAPKPYPQLQRELLACQHCEHEGLIPQARPIFQLPDKPHQRPVIGLFSQAPGNLAHVKGKPFYDPSGVRLRAWLHLSEDEFYDKGVLAILPMAFCFPGYDGKSRTGKGGDLPPPKVCAEKWRPQMLAGLPNLKIILLVGQYAQRWHLGARMKKTLTATVADWPARFEEAEETGVLLLPMPHPSWRNTAWLKKNPWFEAEVIPRLRDAIAAALPKDRGASEALD
ncbi:MAG: uracil-DNA glycosylase family protein [Pseudomonadota bacterium]